MILAACTSTIPEYNEFLEVNTRQGLLKQFGKPLSYRSDEFFPDVVSVLDPPREYYYMERWSYPAVKDEIEGKAHYIFYVSKNGEKERFGDRNWNNR